MLFLFLRNLRASLRTYFPVKPDAPKIIMSNVFTDDAIVTVLQISCFKDTSEFTV